MATRMRVVFPYVVMRVAALPPAWPPSRCIDFTMALALGLWCL